MSLISQLRTTAKSLYLHSTPSARPRRSHASPPFICAAVGSVAQRARPWFSEVLGKEVRFQQTTFEAYKERFLGFGMSDAMAQGQTDMAWAKNEGLDNAVERTSENSTPTSFREWCERCSSPQ